MIKIDFKAAYDSVPRQELFRYVHKVAKERGIHDEMIVCEIIEELFHETIVHYGG